jgi:integrase
LKEYKSPQLPSGLRPHVFDTYEMFVNTSIIPALGSHKLLKLRPEHIQSYFNSYKKKNGEPPALSTLKQHKCILSGALGQAVKNGLITRNPVDALSLPKTKSAGKKKVHAFTPDEQRALLTQFNEHRLYALIALAIYSGMRIGENLALQWESVDFVNGEVAVMESASSSKNRDSDGNVVTTGAKSSIKVGKAKTYAGFRVIPMTKAMKTVLIAHKEQQANEIERAGKAWENLDLVFCTGLGGRLEYRNVTRLFEKMRNRAEISPYTFHSLRHSFATNAITASMDYYYLSKIMGHANISITLDTYADYMPNKACEEMRKLDSFDLTEN